MFNKATCGILMAVLATAFAGCNSQTNSLFGQNNSTLTPATNAAEAPLPPAQPNPATPYVLSAQSAGPYIDFNIYNLGSTDLVVSKDNFAILEPQNRRVVPYSKDNAIIDLPQPSVVAPNSSMNGRVIFKEVASPIGKRLVFKPDEIGTYADINRATAR